MAVPRRKARTSTVTVKLPAALSGRLASLASKRRVSKSAVIRDLLVVALEAAPGLLSESFLDGAGDLAGCVSGPADLATDPRHLEGFGE